MKTLRWLILFLLLAGLSAQAQLQRSDTKESLRGLNGVYIAVQIVDAQPEGITTNSVETLVKTALAGAGIPINASPKKFNGDANLSVTVDTIKQPQLDAYVFMVEVAVTQDVRLARDPHAPWTSAETWRRSLQGITSPDRTDVIQTALKQTLNRFITAYRAVNPPAH